jgi:site-specific DNA-methyltransferase (adenine-specific)
MIKPYYSEPGITIYHGDCRDILPHLEPVDLVLTDPQYGMDYFSNHYKGENPHSKVIGDDKPYPVEILRVLIDMARNAVFTFCRWNNLCELPEPKSFIVWAKNNWSAGDLEHEYARQWEGIAFYPKNGHKFIYRPADIIDSRRVPPTDLLHPTQKPLGVVSALLKANIGNVILDPFMGSGTTLRAAKDLGRKAIGIEIEEKYCEIAVRRLKQEVLPLTKGG